MNFVREIQPIYIEHSDRISDKECFKPIKIDDNNDVF